jgi:hypothetical protein
MASARRPSQKGRTRSSRVENRWTRRKTECLIAETHPPSLTLPAARGIRHGKGAHVRGRCLHASATIRSEVTASLQRHRANERIATTTVSTRWNRLGSGRNPSSPTGTRPIFSCENRHPTTTPQLALTNDRPPSSRIRITDLVANDATLR